MTALALYTSAALNELTRWGLVSVVPSLVINASSAAEAGLVLTRLRSISSLIEFLLNPLFGSLQGETDRGFRGLT